MKKRNIFTCRLNNKDYVEVNDFVRPFIRMAEKKENMINRLGEEDELRYQEDDIFLYPVEKAINDYCEANSKTREYAINNFCSRGIVYYNAINSLKKLNK